jgi:hypothetical protein
MSRLRALALSSILLIVPATAALAEGTVQQKTHVQFGGFVGGVVNVFGGKAAREGVTSTTAIKGNRRLTANERTGELVDLSEEKVYHLDYGRKTYEVVTFAELRKQYEDARKKAAEEAKDDDEDKPKKKDDGPEYEVDFSVKDTGQKQTINGFDTRQVIATATVHEKGKKLEQSGGAVLTADMWMGPKIPAMREINAFNEKYYRQLYGDPTAEMQQMAVLLATTPTFAKAMKELSKKRSSFEGEPIRTTLTFESVAAPGQQPEEEESTSLVGGLLRGAMKKRQERKGEPAAPGHSKLFDSTSEILSASSSAAAVAIPAGFKQR